MSNIKQSVITAFSIRNNIHSIFYRKPSNYAVIDGLRAISIILVLFFHVFFVYYEITHASLSHDGLMNEHGWFWFWVWNGDKGVDIFFVMSGFLISGILLKQVINHGRIDLKNFYIRRYFRLTPAYYLTLIIYWLIFNHNSEWIWANFLYVSNFVYYGNQAVGWTWSLAVEEQFYFIYPLLLIVLLKYSKSPGYMMLWLFLISFLVRYGIVMSDEDLRMLPFSRIYEDKDYFNQFFTVLYDNLHSRFGCLLVGCMAAYCFHYHREKLEQFCNSSLGVMTTILGIGLVIFFMVFPIFSKVFDDYQNLQILYYVVNRNLFAMGIGIIIIMAMLQKHAIINVIRKVLSLPMWYPMATLSYSLYLLHLMIMVPIYYWLLNAHPDLSIAQYLFFGGSISVLLSILAASVMFVLVEKPVMNLRR